MEEGPEPGLQLRFSLLVETGTPVVVGALATGGVRRHVPVIAGHLECAEFWAQIIPGHGGEIWLERGDGVTVIEVHYLLRTAAGQVARVLGSGYATKAPHYPGTRITLIFEVEESGALSWLAERVFVAQRAAAAQVFDVAMVI